MKRFLLGCLYAVLALVLFVVLVLTTVYLGHGIAGSHHVAAAKRAAAADIRASLPQARMDVERDRRLVLAEDPARRSPTYSWTELVCSIENVDSGWIVDHYEQDCDVRTVDLFPAPAPADGCSTPQFPDRPAGAVGEPAVSVQLASSARMADDGPQADWSCPDGIGRRFLAGSVERVVSGTKPDDLGASPGWRVVVVKVEVSRSALGCHPWHPVFCDPPVEEPVLGD